MYCENCGAKLSDDVAFCSHCGHKIRKMPDNKLKMEEKSTKNNFNEIKKSNKSGMNLNEIKSKDKNSRYVVIGVSALVLIIIVGTFLLGGHGPAADGTVVLSDTCSIKAIGDNVEVKNHKACWTIENENYTVYYGNYEDNIKQYDSVIGLIEFAGIYGDHNGYGNYGDEYVISKCNGDDAIFIKAKNKAIAETLEDNIQFK